MRSDPSLKKYENKEDVAKPDWTIEQDGEEIIVHIAWSLNFSIDRPTGDVWRYMRDFNLWLEDLHYNCVVGDAAEGDTVYFTINENSYEHYRKTYGIDPREFKKNLIVRRNEPGRLIVWEELSANKGKLIAYYVWTLSGQGARSTVTGVMSYPPHREPKAHEHQLRANYHVMADDVAHRWRSAYIPRLRQLVEKG